MTPVEFHFVSPTGTPISNTPVEIQLSKSGYDDTDTGIVMPRPVVVDTDAEGYVTVELWPSQILYHVQVWDSESEAVIYYKFYVPSVDVPGTVVRLQDLVVDSPMSGTPYDEAALLVIQNAKANASASAIAAAASAADAATDAASVATGVAAAADSAEAAEFSRIQAQVLQEAALVSQNASQASEDASLASKNAAAASATTATTKATAAAGSATDAATSAGASAASAAAALTSKNSAQATVPVWSATAPLNPVNGAQWIDSDTGQRFTYIQDADSAQWVETGTIVTVGVETALAAQASANAAAQSAVDAQVAGLAVGLSNAVVDGGYNLRITRGDGTTYNAGYVRGERGDAFSVDAIGASLAARAAYDNQADGFSFLDTGAGNLYFRQGVVAGTWSPAIPFGKGEKGDPGTTDFNALANKPNLGTVAPLNVAAAGNASAAQVVKGDDTRLSDARAPTAHTHLTASISDSTATGRALVTAATAAAARTTLVLDNVTNTSDANKPVSTAQQAALDLKANLLDPVFTRNVKVVSDLEVAGVLYAASLVGMVVPFGSIRARAGWLHCNGAAVPVATYANLAVEIYCGDALNATAMFGYRCTDPANPSTTRSIVGAYIVLPEIRGESIRGLDMGRGLDREPNRVIGSIQQPMLLAHDHPVYDPTHGHGIYDGTHAHGGWTDSQGHHDHANGLNGGNGGGLQFGSAINFGSIGIFGMDGGRRTDGAGGHGHNIGIGAAYSNISVYGNATGILVQSRGGSEMTTRNIALPYYIKT